MDAAAPGCLEHAICQTPEIAAATCAELSGRGERISSSSESDFLI